MHAPKVKVAFGRNIGDVGRDALLLAQLPDLRRSVGVVDRREDHGNGGVVEIFGLEFAIEVFDLVVGYTMCDFGVEAVARTDDGDFGVGVEKVENAAGGNLDGQM